MISRLSLKRAILVLSVLLICLSVFLMVRARGASNVPAVTLVERVNRGLKPEDEQAFRAKLAEMLAQKEADDKEGKRDVNLYLRIGVQYYILGEVANAASSYRDVLVTHPADAPALENLGQALVEMGDYAGALEAWQRAATSDPTEQTYVNMADLMRDHLPEVSNRIPLVLEHGIATLGQKYSFLIRLGDWYASQGDFTRAVSHYEVALQLNKNEDAAAILETYRQKARAQEAAQNKQ